MWGKGPKKQELSVRFWRRVKKGADCWEWQGCKNPHGYGIVQIGTTALAHRLAWMLEHGEWPDGLFVCHRCDNPSCVNPAHLFLGTHRDNMKDASTKGNRKGIKNSNVKLTETAVLEIRKCFPATSKKKLAARFGVSRLTIKRIVEQQNWTHL